MDALQAALPHAPLPLDTLLAWAATWVRRGGRLLAKPTQLRGAQRCVLSAMRAAVRS